MPHVIGTAGHVDHGKSTLVRALTGIDPDRLAEEKAREMTIDLGFAWFDLPSGETVGIVDVPGHRDFIENMLAGVGGIDLALFVVAADEGVMPQTQEHLAILDLLEIPRAIVALTKIDMITDPDWLDLVTLDLTETFENTVLEAAPIIPVSSRTGAGLSDLVEAIQRSLEGALTRPDRGQPRLPVDRVFTMSGFGTIVTGTLIDGSFAVGDEVEITPSGIQARIRGLQTHQTSAARVDPGSRVALNLGGISTNDIARGDVVGLPGLQQGTSLVDTQFRYLQDAGRALKHNAEVKFFSGSVETIAHVRLLGSNELAPGESGWIQLKLAAPVALANGDRFILRYPSPGQTIGGGKILDAHPLHRWRRFHPEVLKRYETLATGRPEDRVLQTLEGQIALSLEQIMNSEALPHEEALQIVQTLSEKGLVTTIADKWIMAAASWNRVLRRMVDELGEYHLAQPLQKGMPREALRSRMALDGKLFNVIVHAARAEQIVESGTVLHLAEHVVEFSDPQQIAINRLLKQIQANPTAPPNPKEMAAQVGEDVLQALLDRGDLIQLNTDVIMDSDTLSGWHGAIKHHLEKNGTITVAEVRDLLSTSRKYALGLLEYLDEQGITRRVGDERVIRGSPH